jgi:hypothetical protein
MPISRVLPLGLMIALSASPHVVAQEDPKIAEGVAFCVKMREQIYACREDFADAFVAMRNPPLEERAKLRKRALEEIAADGSGPLPPRQQKCARMGHSLAAMGPETLASSHKKLSACGAIKDCKKRVSCIRELMVPGRPPEPQK